MEILHDSQGELLVNEIDNKEETENVESIPRETETENVECIPPETEIKQKGYALLNQTLNIKVTDYLADIRALKSLPNEKLSKNTIDYGAYVQEGTYEKRDPELAKYHYKKVPYYDELAIIVGDDETTSKGDVTGVEADKDMSPIEEIGVSHGSPSIHSNEDAEIQSGSDTLPINERRRPKEDMRNSSIDVLADAAQRIAEAIERSDMGKRSDMRKIQEELAKLDLDRSLFLEAATYLGRDPNEAHIFFGLNDEFKEEWLMKVMEKL